MEDKLEVVRGVSANRAKTGNSSLFQPGQSGNPNGRPKLAEEFRDLARQYSVPALKRVAEIVTDPTARNQDVIAAARLILERGFGSPIQDIAISRGESREIESAYDLSAITTEEKMLLADTLAKALRSPK
jgi:hypothetical protein